MILDVLFKSSIAHLFYLWLKRFVHGNVNSTI
jgi:hypothetical protein